MIRKKTQRNHKVEACEIIFVYWRKNELAAENRVTKTCVADRQIMLRAPFPQINAAQYAQILSIAETEDYFMTPPRRLATTVSTFSPLQQMMQAIIKGEIACHWQLPILGQ
ncbi:hypothetical protein [Pectobacterium punjabense]|uniref:hypothetical protein n=1 Tax=Pectobacterium punjabense TaxID=2108399 RepID=UPI0019691845|nr:hypothetical protein [Pectobacterium punjabense]MBN3135560.1 hypothetical protein [Pectobacterium punjabense]MCE5382470.1 hypothetical protein [Pectobacterium punjabense]MDG0799208.1 hypothetical protein [Pectobacterium punjabense]